MRALESAWLIEAESPVTQVGVDLRMHMDANDGLQVAALSGQNAWASIEAEAVRFLKDRFDWEPRRGAHRF